MSRKLLAGAAVLLGALAATKFVLDRTEPPMDEAEP